MEKNGRIQTSKYVLSNWIAWLDEIWLFSGLDRKKSDRIAANCILSNAEWANATVYFLDTAASTCCTANGTNNAYTNWYRYGYADDVKGTGDSNARKSGKDAGTAVRADKEEVGRD
jgi:hypothetical protein